MMTKTKSSPDTIIRRLTEAPCADTCREAAALIATLMDEWHNATRRHSKAVEELSSARTTIKRFSHDLDVADTRVAEAGATRLVMLAALEETRRFMSGDHTTAVTLSERIDVAIIRAKTRA